MKGLAGGLESFQQGVDRFSWGFRELPLDLSGISRVLGAFSRVLKGLARVLRGFSRDMRGSARVLESFHRV